VKCAEEKDESEESEKDNIKYNMISIKGKHREEKTYTLGKGVKKIIKKWRIR
jgi:hypothetical protein